MKKVDLKNVTIKITYHSADQHRIRCLKQSKEKINIYDNQIKLKKQILANHYYEDVIRKRRKYALEFLRTKKGEINKKSNTTYLTNGSSVLVGVLEENNLVVVTAYPAKREI